MPAETAWSAGERLRGRAFDRMSPSELREAERLIDRMVLRMPLRRTRRWKLHRRGTAAGAASDDAPQPGHRRRPHRVALASPRGATAGRGAAVRHQSGSMERHARLLLRFSHALSRTDVPTEAFCFGTRLTRITPQLRHRDPDEALRRISAAVDDWSGGTRIGTRSTSSTSAGRDACSGRAASCSWSAMAGTAATRARSASRRRGCGAPVTGSSGSTRWRVRRATGRWRRAWRPPGRTSTCSCPRTTWAAWSCSAGAAGGGAGGRCRRADGDDAPMKDLVSELATLGRHVAADGASGGGPHLRLGAATGGCRAARERRRPAGGLGQRRLRRGCRVRGGRAGAGEPATRGSSATASATSRRGTWAWPVAAPSTCWSSRSRQRSGRAARGHGRRPGPAVITPLPADSPGPVFGPHPPGDGAPPATPLVFDLRRAAVRHDRRRRRGRGSWRRPPRTPWSAAGRATVELAGRSWFVEAFPLRPRLVIVGAVQVAISLVALARTLGYETVVIDGRASFATRERFPDADQLLVGWPDELADAIGLGPRTRSPS